MKFPRGQICNLSGIILYPSYSVGPSDAGICNSHHIQSMYVCVKSILLVITFDMGGTLLDA